LTIGAKRALARIEDDFGEVEPPGRKAQTFERLRRFFNGEQSLEVLVARLFPASYRAFEAASSSLFLYTRQAVRCWNAGCRSGISCEQGLSSERL